MRIPTPAAPDVPPANPPTPAQLEREAALRRFNRLYVYAPMILATLLVVGLLLYLLWQTLSQSPESPIYGLLSGLADLLLIFALLPMMLLCAIGPAATVLLLRQMYRQTQLEPDLRRGRLQTLFWRLDRLLTQVQTQLRDSYLEKIASPVIRGHAFLAALNALGRFIQNWFRPSKNM